jgi:hypothetical protein
MLNITVDDVLAAMSRKGYRVFDTPTKDWNLNVVGIRSRNLHAGEFDDSIAVFHRFSGSWAFYLWPITTDPGTFYLEHPLRKAGTAILKEGRYRGVYKIDIHARGSAGAHKALCQRLGNVTVYRDPDRDDELNIIPGNEETGLFGINIHRARRIAGPLFLNCKASAGCQVFADCRDFDLFMTMCENGKKAFGNKFTYTLLNESDF